jgi:CHAT domain-containing protein
MGVLASLWQVNDISTALLMVKFYELLTPNTSISLALHQAQLWFKSATTKTLQTWVKDSPSFSAKQKEDIETQLDGYGSEEKPYNKIHHWAAFCAIGL